MKRKTITIEGIKYESCTGVEWDSESELTREFINFGDGFVYARRVISI